VNEFVHLHTHSEYSLLDGLSRIKHLVAEAQRLGMPALALTDHGALYGAIEFYQACQSEGIKPIIGLEAYLTPRSMDDRSGRYDYFHLLLLAKDNTGYRNLLKLTTEAHTRGYHLRPRIDRETLAKYAQGLIATSSCLSGEVPDLLLKGDLNGARQTLNWYREVFGPENYYLEIQEHHSPDGQQARLNTLLYELHRETGIPLVATNDLHYVKAEDARTQDILLCVQTGKTFDDPRRMRFDTNEYYLRSPAEMWELFADVPDALTNTLRIAEMCNVDIRFGVAQLPEFPIPDGFASQAEYMYHLCLEGVRERYGTMTAQIKERLDYEFTIIRDKGFVPYFLVVWDYVNYARQHGIRCSGRGSASGSIVAYVLGFTNIDPLQYGLLFERFLNPERSSLPDIDMDFPDDRREEVIQYVANKYGADRVAQIITFNTMAARAAVRDVGRVMSRQNEADRIARLIPPGPKVTLRSALNDVRELQALYEESPTVREIIDAALALEGTVRSTGVHAAGVVVARDPLVEMVPLQLRDTRDANSWLVAQYEQAHLESLGLLKFDFLGLSNITILQNTVKFIRQSRGIELDLDRIPPDDEETFKLLSSGETTGIFQLESAAMRQYIRELQPTCIDDLVAMVALYRPGPMDSIPDFIAAKHGRKKVVYLHPSLETYLKESYGVIVYQDQVLLIAVNLAGFTWGEVDKFRKALSKKKMDEVVQYRGKFVAGCVQNGIPRDTADAIFTLIEPFGGYGFPKAHAASYAWVAYQTAYLKAHYTPEFMAATLTTEANDLKKVATIIAECARMGVPVLRPDINASDEGFTVEGNGVRFGLLAIKNVGAKPVQAILEARRQGGPFTSLVDICARVDARALNRSALECLIRVGALDSLGGTRAAMLESLDRAMKLGQQQAKMRELGQGSLFGDTASGIKDFKLKHVPEKPLKERLAWEKELMGLYFSEHPLKRYEPFFKKYNCVSTSALTEEYAGQKVTLAGRVASVRRMPTKKGDSMAFIELEDAAGTIEVTVFPRVYEATSGIWEEDAVVLLTGKVEVREETIKILCETAEPFPVAETDLEQHHHLVQIILQRTHNDTLDLARADNLLTLVRRYHDGMDRYEIVVRNDRWEAVLVPEEDSIRYCPEFHVAAEELLGAGAVHVQPLGEAAHATAG
jgi:DNA polymerase-3 subunit alpha